MSQIELGKGVKLDLRKFLRTRMLIAASSGGGKSWTTRRLLEQTHGKVQQIVLDYEGEFASLREKFDYVLVGKGGEIAADVRYAPQLARRLMELNVSAVIDLFELKVDDRKEFVKVFLETLIDGLPKELWHPVIVVVDEAHVLCPEKGKGESVATSAVIELTTRGRKRGFCAVLATQDIAKLNKDATGECRNRLIGLAVEDKTRKRSGEELGLVDKDQVLALRNLEPGEFYAFGPAIGNEVKRVLIGPVVTSHPDIGTRKGRKKWMAPPPPREKVKAILSKLADLPQEAAEEIATLDSLRRENAQLKIEIRRQKQSALESKAAQPLASSKTKVERVEVFVIKDKQIHLLEQAARGLRRVLVDLGTVRDKFDANSADLLDAIQRAEKSKHMAVAQAPVPSQKRLVAALQPAPRQRVSLPMGNAEVTKLGLAERKILTALATYPAGRTITQVALLTGYAKNGGAFRNPLGSLRSKGFIEGRDSLSITNEGLAALGNFEPLPLPGPQLLAYWNNHLGHAEREILRVLSEAWPESLTVEQIAEGTQTAKGGPYDANGGAFRNPLGRLRTLELVVGRGKMKVSDDLMGGAS